MSFDYTLNDNGHTDEHSDSPVCRVLRNYFQQLAEFGRQVEEQRRGSLQQNPLAQIGVNDVVQEG